MKSIITFIKGLFFAGIFGAILLGLLFLVKYAFKLDMNIIDLALKGAAITLVLVWFTLVICLVAKLFRTTEDQLGRSIRERVATAIIPNNDVLKRLLQEVLIEMNRQGFDVARDVLNKYKRMDDAVKESAEKKGGS